MSISRLLLLPALLSACTPQVFQRQTVTLDHAELERFEIRYAELPGCLWRRQVPVHYRLERAGYVLDFDIDFGLDRRKPELELNLSPAQLSARFPGLDPAPIAEELEQGKRYQLAMSQLDEASFVVEVLSQGVVLGRERLVVEQQTCRGLSFWR